MSLSERTRLALQAYHDDELGRLRRRWVEWRLRGSAEMRDELRELEALGSVLSEALAEHESLDSEPPRSIWTELAPELAAVDSELGRSIGGAPSKPSPIDRLREGLTGVGAWGGLAGAAVAAALLVVMVGGIPVGLTPDPATMSPPVVAGGSVRYLNTSGRPVAVSQQEAAGVTIIWLMDAPGDA